MTQSQGRTGVQEYKKRILVLVWAVGLGFSVLFFRLYNLQIVRGSELSERGQSNFIKRQPLPHDRGIIYDRYGRILVDNHLSLTLQLTPAFVGNRAEQQDTLNQLRELLHLSDERFESLEEALKLAKGLARFRPIMIKRDLNANELDRVESLRSLMLIHGVDIVKNRRRTYPHGALATHLLGYVNEVSQRDLDVARQKGNPYGYKMGNLIGRSGIEEHYEESLRGVDGYKEIVVDAKGRRVGERELARIEPTRRRVKPLPGKNLFLTIDLDLQREVEKVFFGQAGAVVVIEPDSGSIVALASFPDFDPNQISGALGVKEKQSIDKDPLKPWVNRYVQGQYAPGSTFKVVTALAALQEGLTTPSETVHCPGHFNLGNHTWRCHKESGHGLVNLKDALKYSCDTYFYTLGLRIGIDRLAQMGRSLGLGGLSQVSLRGEKKGIMPDKAFHDRVERKTGGYQKGMVVNTSIGQGAVLTTPLQIALTYAALVNGGQILKPRLVDKIQSADFRVSRRELLSQVVSDDAHRLSSDKNIRVVNFRGAKIIERVEGEGPKILERIDADVLRESKVSQEHLNMVQKGLEAVVMEEGGTAYYRRSRKTTMSGKTGTAQVVRLGANRLDSRDVEYFSRDHAWFAAYAPAQNPDIVIVVLNEHAGHGSSQAAPIAVAVIDKYFELKAQRAAFLGESL
ncbi:MAG: penicillin-binding protein 2 [Myxococcota bacterium]|nr:penicillin-binding protein 2 [Myxococcota bacterium]